MISRNRFSGRYSPQPTEHEVPAAALPVSRRCRCGKELLLVGGAYLFEPLRSERAPGAKEYVVVGWVVRPATESDPNTYTRFYRHTCDRLPKATVAFGGAAS